MANSMTAHLRLNIQNFSQNLERAATSMARFAATAASSSMGANRQFARYGREINEATSALNKHNFGLKDTTRIIQGILVSQAFYGLASAIRDATQSVWAFNESLDYASVTYSALFGDQQLSANFMQVLREHAESTIFSYEQLADSSKKLLAYNIPYENLMYVMNGLTNLGAMSGDAAALDRIALALGQIYTRGKLSAEEMRQLANAYVPIYDIVKDKFGLSSEDMGRIGDLNLPAHEVINAVVDYANEQFGSVGDAAMMTITGLKQKISDALKNLAVDILRPVTVVYKSLLKAISNELEEISNVYASGGLKGVFEHLVPDEAAQERLRLFAANIRALASTVRDFMSIGAQVAGSLATGFINAFNVVAPVVNAVARVISQAIAVITGNATTLNILTSVLIGCAAAWVLFKARALSAMAIAAVAKVIYAVAGAVIFLARALASSPIVTGLILITAGIAGIAAKARGADNAITSLFTKLSSLNKPSGGGGGISDQIDAADDALDDFNNRLEGTEDGIEGVEDALDGAGGSAKKAAAGLLSFDEVFKLNDPSGGGGGGGDEGFSIDDMLDGLGNLGGGLSDALMPEIPDFSEFGEKFISALTGTLLGKLALAGFGALVAKKINKLLADTAMVEKLTPGARSLVKHLGKALAGISIGLAFDAFAAFVTAKLWEALEDNLALSEGSSEAASFAATLGSVIGGAIGMLVGGIKGSLIGAAIGHLAGGIVGLLSEEIGNAFSNTALFGGVGIASVIAKAFGGSIAQLPSLISANTLAGVFKNIGGLFRGAGLKAITKGGAIGMAIGFICDAIAALLWNTLQDKFNLSENSTQTAKVGQTIGSVIGAVIGGIFGGPGGALIGSAIGTFAGGFVGLFWEQISTFFAPVATRIGEMVGGVVSALDTAASGMISWASTSLSNLSSWWESTKTGFGSWWEETTSGFSSWLENTGKIFSDWDSINSETLGTWVSETWDSLSGWVSDTTTDFLGWKEETTTGFTTWKEETVENFMSWKHEVMAPILKFVSESTASITTWCNERKQDIFNFALQTSAKIVNWALETGKSISDWAANAKKSIEDFSSNALEIIGGFAIASYKAIAGWVSDTWEKISNFFVELKGLIKTKWAAAWETSSWATGWSHVSGWFVSMRTSASTWFTSLVSFVKVWWDGLWDTSTWTSGWTHISGWFSSAYNQISSWFSTLASNVATWWSNIFSNLRGTVSLNAILNGPSGNKANGGITGHAVGGIVNREHLAYVAEGNRAEAIIPLQNNAAMQPFVDAVANGLTGNILPTLLSVSGNGSNNNNGLPPMYVGTLIADERGIKQLYKKFEVIRLQEDARRGNAGNGVLA